jgi:hypothetical protein
LKMAVNARDLSVAARSAARQDQTVALVAGVADGVKDEDEGYLFLIREWPQQPQRILSQIRVCGLV